MAALPLSRILKALADPSRLRIVRILDLEELSVGELGDVLEFPQSSVSRHLGVLRDAGVVADRRHGTRAFYRLDPDFRTDHAALVAALSADGDIPAADLSRLDRVLTARAAAAGVFDALADDWDSIRAAQVAPIVSAITVSGLVPAELCIVDVGCGTGAALADLATIASQIHAVDTSAAMLRQARARAKELALESVTFHQAPMDAVPLPDGCADAVLLALVLRHAARPAAALAEAARLVRTGGKIVVVDFVAHDDERFRTELDHLWLGFGEAELHELLTAAGFRPEQHRVVPSPLASASPAGAFVPATFVADATRLAAAA